MFNLRLGQQGAGVMSEKRGSSRGAMPRIRFVGASILAASVALGLVGGVAAEAQARGGIDRRVRAGLRLDVARRGDRPGAERAERRRAHLSGVADQDDDAVSDVRGAQSGTRQDSTSSLRFPPMRRAARRASSGWFPGEAVPLRDLILGLVTRSANDAASVIAENLAGSEANFARYMTWKARQLGMQHTWYQNASGLPDPSQRTTARDVARLSLALYHDFPREYRYFSTQEFYFRGDEINTHNHLLEWYPGRRRHQDRFRQCLGFQHRDLGGAQRAPADRGDHGWSFGAQPRPADGVAARPGFRGARKPPAGAAFGRGGPGRRSAGILRQRDRGRRAAGFGSSHSPAPAPTVSAITAAAGPRASRRAIAAPAPSPRSPRHKPRQPRRHARSCRWSRSSRQSMTRRMTTKASRGPQEPARCAGPPAPRCGIWRRCRKRRPRPPFTSRRLPRTAGASSSAPIATSRRRARRCAGPPASMP